MTGAVPVGRLVVDQIRYQLLSFWRIPIALFFTILLPLVMLVLFNALFGDETVETAAGEWPVRQFYTGGLAAFTAVSATFTNLANMVPIRREEGVLKRWRGTPLPPWIYVAGAIGSAVVIALAGVVLMLAVGVVAYDLQITAAKLPAALLTFLVGVAAFAALGMAVAALVPSPQSASAAANAIILPLAFVSDVFIVMDEPPPWMEGLGNIFPLKHFANSVQAAFNPLVDPPAFQWSRLAFIAAWGLVGAVVALRYFKWEPSGRGTTRHRRRAAATGAD